jgi:membrane protease YdiL (CAAX protease family)
MSEFRAIIYNPHRRATWTILLLLLLLRIPYVIITIYILPIDNQSSGAIYEICTYFLIAFLIWWERTSLADFHIDTTVLAFIILFRPLQTLILSYWHVDSPLAFPRLPSLLIWATSIGLTLALWRSGFKSARFSIWTLSWLTIGLLTGICISTAENFSTFQSIISSTSPVPTSVLLSTSVNLLYHLGFAPINEEPLFRGFLWGALRQLKLNNGWILLIQTLLFTSAHVYFAQQYPLMFWVYIPAAAIVFGLLTLRSRSISAAILAHGMINGSAHVLAAGILSLIHF